MTRCAPPPLEKRTKPCKEVLMEKFVRLDRKQNILKNDFHCFYTVPLKSKLTVPGSSNFGTRSSIIEVRVECIEYRTELIEFRDKKAKYFSCD